ncbi:MAG: hypothetical protein M5U26_29030 [Planctomycetota bacterium]|nr:hypothetical protein [Planctomycetota bacterium]
MPRLALPLALILAAALARAEENELRTTGPVADAPLQVGCWFPVKLETPPWVFPMIYFKWYLKKASVEDLAAYIVAEAKKKPAGEPVWLQIHGWMGNYKPYWDRTNLLAFGEDVTAQNTPGIWPEKGLAHWLENQKKLLDLLKKEKVRLDFWPLDNETSIQEWAHNFQEPYTFRNIVQDPRWKEKKLLGLDVAGGDLFDPAALENEKDVWKRKPFNDIPDSRLAYEWVVVVGHFVASEALTEAFHRPLTETYPHATVSDYNRHRKTIHWDSDAPMGIWGRKEGWMKLHELKPELKEVPGVGNAASPPYYGQTFWLKVHPEAKDTTEAMLMHADEMIAMYGGPERLCPLDLPPELRQGRGRAQAPEAAHDFGTVRAAARGPGRARRAQDDPLEQRRGRAGPGGGTRDAGRPAEGLRRGEAAARARARRGIANRSDR